MTEPNSADLLRDHAAIESLSARLAHLIDRDAGSGELALALEHLVSTVADHLSIEDAMIYTLAMRAGSNAEAESADRMHSDFVKLKDDWGAYLTLWSAEAITADRGAFIDATRAMLPRLRDRVQLENALLFHAGQSEFGGRSVGNS